MLCVQVCVWFVCFEVFGVTSLIKEYWKPKCLSLSVFPPLSVLSSSLSVPDAPPHSLSQSQGARLVWNVFLWVDVPFVRVDACALPCMCVCPCLLCGHFPLRLHSPEQLSSPGHKADACYPDVTWTDQQWWLPRVTICTDLHTVTHTLASHLEFLQGCLLLHLW